ncbi:pseudouridine synthase [Fragilariopsis cylindrus CCMP1102]|uniref:Pseudouridine synthase n=1 Tax=Fragilariopsis cylindrus CCMP1102 TaxID=635003 RepID=A0A1E7F160_9STRA|nr:pseudouridine synthase [Fragilariopsis cylindrus CCMP1102]|eukprot:OEU11543.1 pseudouridine synthase [Fragilariopsis cylindrus CCMP1102]
MATTTTVTQTNTFPPIPVLFESSRLLIIHKPHGIGHHDESSTLSSSDQQEKPGILQILRHQRREEKEDKDDDNNENENDNENENEERLYGIHRLDKVTSGILVFAKDSTTASILSKYFQEKKIQKIYFGVSSKKSLKKKQGLVQGGMERSRNKGWILNDKSNDDDDDNVVKTVVMFRPYTGKTHQLRVAAKSMGIPLLGDPIYKDGGNGGNSSTSTSSSRTMLHASGIQIPAFLDHNEINIWCPPTFFDDNDDDIIDDDDDDPAEDRILSDTLDKAVEKLMTKNCDVDGILEAMKLTNKMKHNAIAYCCSTKENKILTIFIYLFTICRFQ